MEKVYVFKVALKYTKGLWRRIEIKGSQTLGNFDSIIRIAFNYDTKDKGYDTVKSDKEIPESRLCR